MILYSSLSLCWYRGFGWDDKGVEFPVEIGCTDPRSQKRDPTARRGRLGHPSMHCLMVANAGRWVIGLLSESW
jgi:hypothetical protein